MLKYGLEIFDNIQRCQSLLKDYAAGWFNWEMEYFLIAIKINAHSKIIESNKMEKDILIKELSNELKNKSHTSYEIANDIILLLYNVLCG
jgi:hypothetical protein